jgi:protein phosphatase
MEGEVYPDVQSIALLEGDMLLLCSDGLTGMLSDKHIAQILKANPNPEETCNILVDTANEAGGKDNITAVVVNMGDTNIEIK